MIRTSLLASLVLLPVALGGCSSEQTQSATGRSPQDAASLTACRQRIDSVVAQRDRALLYTDDANAQRNMNGRGDPSVEINQMARRYDRDRQVDNCMRGDPGTQTTTPAANAPAPVIVR